MSVREHCTVLDKFNSPAGDCATLTSYREYVERMCRSDLTIDEVRDLLIWFHCGLDEVVDRICELKLAEPAGGKGKHGKRTG